MWFRELESEEERSLNEKLQTRFKLKLQDD